MDEGTRERVRRRAENRCEYCGAREGLGARLRFHIEHIIARQHGGGDELENLALACHLCNAHKGPNLTGIDPATGNIVPLFHPRRDRWNDTISTVRLREWKQGRARSRGGRAPGVWGSAGRGRPSSLTSPPFRQSDRGNRMSTSQMSPAKSSASRPSGGRPSQSLT